MGAAKVNMRRAVVALGISAFVPGALVPLVVHADGDMIRFPAWLFWVLIMYAFSLPLVMTTGFACLFIAGSIRNGPILVPPVAGAVGGFLVALLLNQMAHPRAVIVYTFAGLLTALVAALIYYRPWSRIGGV